MTAIQFFNAFRIYGADVLLLALAVTLITALLKKTVMKHCSKKIFVFLPFLIGTAVYAAYRAIVTMSAIPFTEELTKTLEGGFGCGCAATLYYVIYEQFFRTKSQTGTTTALSPLLEGYVPEEKRAAAEEALLAGVEKSGEELELFVKETLAQYTDPAISEAEFLALTTVVAEYLARLKG